MQTYNRFRCLGVCTHKSFLCSELSRRYNQRSLCIQHFFLDKFGEAGFSFLWQYIQTQFILLFVCEFEFLGMSSLGVMLLYTIWISVSWFWPCIKLIAQGRPVFTHYFHREIWAQCIQVLLQMKRHCATNFCLTQCCFVSDYGRLRNTHNCRWTYRYCYRWMTALYCILLTISPGMKTCHVLSVCNTCSVLLDICSGTCFMLSILWNCFAKLWFTWWWWYECIECLRKKNDKKI